MTTTAPSGDRIKGLRPSLAVYRRTANGSETLADRTVARPGDVLRVGYHAAGRPYGVIFSMDGRGTVTMHLPAAGDHAVPLAREATTLLDQAYELDDAPLWERFYFVTGDSAFAAAPVVDAARRAAGDPRPARLARAAARARTVDLHPRERGQTMNRIPACLLSRRRGARRSGRRRHGAPDRCSATRSSSAPMPAAPIGRRCNTRCRTPSGSRASSSTSAACAPANQTILRQPTLRGMTEALDLLTRHVTEGRRGGGRTEVILYYSGHADEKGLLLGDDRYSYRTLRDRLDQIPADVRIAVLDACSSGAFTRIKSGRPRPAFLVDESADMRGHAFLTSSSESEAAQESDRIRASYFTHYLISGFRGAADLSGDGKVTLNEAYQFAFNETLGKTVDTKGGAQHPSYDINLSGTGDVVMTDVRQTTATLVLGEELEGRFFVRTAARSSWSSSTSRAAAGWRWRSSRGSTTCASSATRSR